MRSLRPVSVVLILAAALAFSAGVHAQHKGPKFLKATPIVPKSVPAGAPFTLAVAVSIDAPYHVQANPSKEGYIATELDLGAVKGFKVDKVVYPKPVQTAMGGEQLPVYEGKVAIKMDIMPDKSIKPGKYLLPVTLKYQGCNDKACYPPATLDMKVAVTVAATGARQK